MIIFEVMGIDTGIFPKMSFDTSEKQVSDYDIIIRVIGELKDDDQKRREVFEKIRGVFFDGKDITDKELIDELVVAAGYLLKNRMIPGRQVPSNLPSGISKVSAYDL